MPTTGRNRGQIVPRGDRKWLLRVFIGRSAEGKRKYASKTVEGTHAHAQQALTKMLRELDTETFVEPSKQTLFTFLTSWLTAKTDVSDTTRRDYAGLLSRHVIPQLGHHKLQSLSSPQLSRCYQIMLDAGLSPRSIQYTHTVLSQALSYGVRWGFLLRNPAEHVILPKMLRREMATLTPDQAQTLIEHSQGDALGLFWATLLSTGLRPAEALALRWADLSQHEHTWSFSVQRSLVETDDGWEFRQPKTKRSRRTVSIPQFLTDRLQSHRKVQLETILKTGKDYQRQDLIFAGAQGQALDLSQIRKAWKRTLTAAALPQVRLYDTRHTHASMLLAAGENLKTVADRLGHATVAMTGDVYSHVLPEVSKQTANIVQGLLKGGLSK